MCLFPEKVGLGGGGDKRLFLVCLKRQVSLNAIIFSFFSLERESERERGRKRDRKS
jgi:hypothetical protein